MTSPHGRRLQTRRALAIMTWATLTLAWLLWYGQRMDVIRIQAWEPAALVLSAYATFLSIFGWMLFSPSNRSPEESPGLFFSGMLTLIPPCYIAYNLMPELPLRPWLTIGVFLFGVLAIMSPLPKEVFAVPRDRRSYLQPLTDAYLSAANTEPPEIRFDELLPKTRFWLTQPEEEPRQREAGRDPWEDPFYGTGRQMSRVGVSITSQRIIFGHATGGWNWIWSRESRSPGKILRPQETHLITVVNPHNLERPKFLLAVLRSRYRTPGAVGH